LKKAIVYANKVSTFAPATTQTFLEILTSQTNNNKENLFSKKDSKSL
jgi:hypothetical protein